jgi:hypothetical protein
LAVAVADSETVADATIAKTPTINIGSARRSSMFRLAILSPIGLDNLFED